MKIDKNFVAFTGIAGVFVVLILVVAMMGLGKGVSTDFVSMAKIVTGVAMQIFNVSGGTDKPAEGDESASQPEQVNG